MICFMILAKPSHAPRTQKDRTEETKRRLVQATIETLLEVGAGGATVTEICKRAGVTSGAIQHHFGSKAGLMQAVVEALFVPFTEETPALGPEAATLEDRMDRYVRLVWSTYGDRRYFAVLEVLLAARHDPDLMELVSSRRVARVEVTRRFVAREFADVDLPEEKMLSATQRVLDLMRGHVLLRLFDAGPAGEQDMLDEARAILRRAFLPAVRPEAST